MCVLAVARWTVHVRQHAHWDHADAARSLPGATVAMDTNCAVWRSAAVKWSSDRRNISVSNEWIIAPTICYQSHRGRVFTSVCLRVCLFFRKISQKTDQLYRITKLDESWKPIYFGVRRSKVKVTSRKKNHCRRGSLHSCECWLLLVHLMNVVVSRLRVCMSRHVLCIVTLTFDLLTPKWKGFQESSWNFCVCQVWWF